MSLNEEFQPIILAGGYGSRLRVLVDELPKSLLTVCNRPLLSYQLDLLEATGFNNAIILTRNSTKHPLERFVKEQYTGKLSLVLMSEDDHLGMTDTLVKISYSNRKQFIVISGDLIVDPGFVHSMLDLHLARDATASFALQESISDNGSNPSKMVRSRDIIGLEGDKNRLLFMVSSDDYADTPLKVNQALLEKFPYIKIHRNILDTHFYIFSRFALEILRRQKFIQSIKYEFLPLLLRCQYRTQLVEGIENKNPQEAALAMSSTLAMDEGVCCLVYMLDPKTFCARANTIGSYLESNIDIATGNRYFKPIELARYKSFISPTTIVSKQTQIGDHCVIGDSTSIGALCGIKSSVIGKHCQIANNVKMSNCVVMDNVTIQEHCKLTNTIVCNNANIDSNAILIDSIVGYRCTVTSHSEHNHATLSVDLE